MNNPLLQTKLHIPKTPPGLVPRERLIKRLDAGRQGKLTLVAAPAGFGKTALLSAWASSGQYTVTWLSLERGDQDPARFWMYFIAAIQKVHPTIGERALAMLQEQGPLRPTTEYVLSILLNDIAVAPDDFVVVLDDIHTIDTPEIYEGLSFLLDHLPGSMHLIVSGRSDPPLRLANWRARDQLTEIRADDLRFTDEEIRILLQQRLGLALSTEEITALERRTGGWAVGLQLAAGSMQGHKDIPAFIASFTGSHRHIVDYLTEEVLLRQPEAVQDFLLHTCILDTLCASLCQAVTGLDRSQAMLEQLEQENLFIVTLDDHRQWFRYHPLWADMLRSRIQHTDPERIPDLHRRAGQWYSEHGFTHEAIRHVLAAGETLWASRLVEQHVEELLRRGEGHTLREWFAAFPPEWVRTRPRLGLARAIAAINAGDLQAVEPLLKDAEQWLVSTTNEEPFEPSIGRAMSMLTNVPAAAALLRAGLAASRGNAVQMTELIHRAEAHLGEDDRAPRISIRWNLAQADWMRGQLAEAEKAFSSIAAEGRATGVLHLALSASAIRSRILHAQGRLAAAERVGQECLSFAERAAQGSQPSTAVIHASMAAVLYERNQLEQAEQHAREAISLGRHLTVTQTLADALTILAWIRRALGDPSGAREVLDEAYSLITNTDVVELHNAVPAHRARFLLAQGEVQEAARWIKERGLAEEDEIGYAHEAAYLVLARYLLRQNRPDRALTLLERLAVAASDQARAGDLIQIQALQALGLQSAGMPDQAIGVLAQALRLAEPEGYVRTFVDEGSPMGALLHRALLRKIVPDVTARLLSAFPTAGLGGEATSSADDYSFQEPLSEREQEVLRLLAIGSSNQEIAGKLSISLATVRKHVSNILGKLGVSNRTQAVARSRDLGLL